MPCSQKVVEELARLPQFESVARKGSRTVVVRLTDGMEVAAPDESEDCDDGTLAVMWSGRDDVCYVSAQRLVEVEIVTAVDLWLALGREVGDRANLVAITRQYFKRVTGLFSVPVSRE